MATMNRLLLGALLVAVHAAPLVAQQAKYRDALFQVQKASDLVYGRARSVKTGAMVDLKLDRWVPSGDASLARPAVVLVHGGGFTGGSKKHYYLDRLGRGLASRGYVAVSIDYRLLPSRPRVYADLLPAFYDMKAAVRFLRRNATAWRLDVERIACLGSSAGAYMCLEVAYGTSGPGNSGSPGYRDDVQVVVDLWGALNDVSTVQAGDAPLMIVHGIRDGIVPFSNATALYKRVRQLGIPYEYYPLSNAGHAPWNLFDPAFHDDVYGFFFTHLKLDQLVGLRARPGYSSPGTLHLDGFGARGESAMLFVSLGQAPFRFLDLGVFCLDTRGMLALATAGFATNRRQPMRTISFPVPAGHSGLTVFWQEIRADPALGPRTVTNCVKTTL